MDEKRAVFLLFNTKEACADFIAQHGDDEHPETLGLGVAPKMEEGFYNICGKTALEEVYDTLNDGEYAKEPVEFAGKFCYLKRIKTYSPLQNDETVKEIIQNDKAAMRPKEGD